MRADARAVLINVSYVFAIFAFRLRLQVCLYRSKDGIKGSALHLVKEKRGKKTRRNSCIETGRSRAADAILGEESGQQIGEKRNLRFSGWELCKPPAYAPVMVVEPFYSVFFCLLRFSCSVQNLS